MGLSEDYDIMQRMYEAEATATLHCSTPRVKGGGGGSSRGGAPLHVPGSNDPPDLETLLLTDGAPRYHVDYHGVHWEISRGFLILDHSAQREQLSGWGMPRQLSYYRYSYRMYG
eukprot:scaffold12077_cov57-Attheya_sp.AAC.3